MALKGTTKIELTNVKTGEKEVHEKHNLVTNAVPSILDNPFAWQVKSAYGSYAFLGNILPLCPNLFGGVLLYEDSIPEDVNQLFAQSTNALVGYSSNNVNSKTDPMRGSMNLNESGVLDSRDGYRYVFDFTTSQANGTISAVGLTSKWGGMVGYGSNEWKNTQCPTAYFQLTQQIANVNAILAYVHLIHYDADSGIATAIYVSGQNAITVTRVQLHTKNWNLVRNMNMFDTTKVLETQTVETEMFAGTSVTTEILYHNFCDSGDGYIWGFEHSGNGNGNSSGKASINWIKLKIDDLSIEEGTWEIDAQIYAMGKSVNPIDYGYRYVYTEQSNSVILDGYLYCFNYACTGIYKINLKNITDTTFIEHPDKNIKLQQGNSNNYYFYYAVANMTVSGNKICLWDGWLNGDRIVKNLYQTGSSTSGVENLMMDGWIDANSVSGGFPYRNSAGRYGLSLGVFRLMYTGFASTNTGSSNPGAIYARLLLDAPYLATINNLPTPVQKTADKTMKITYILREES